ncbi:MAG: hypothetical protein IJX08_04115 [Clostridia bacterium]|nr:hypothetical protein [Clostridia bacterium]
MKRSVFLRAAALVLILCLGAPMFLSCRNLKLLKPQEEPSEGESEGAHTSQEQGSPTEEELLPQVSFNGEKILFAIHGSAHSHNGRSIDVGEDDDPDNAVNMLIKRRNEYIEKKLNVDIAAEYYPGGSVMVDAFNLQLASKTYFADVVGHYQDFDLGLTLEEDKRGAYYNLNNLPKGVQSYLNFERSYWDQVLYEELSYKGTAYFFTGDLNLSHASTMFVSYVNTDLWARYADKIAKLSHSGGYSDPYDIVKNGYWTMDLLIELSVLVYIDNGNTEGKVDYEDQVGVITYNEQLNNVMADMFVAGSHLNFANRSADGTPTVTIDTKENEAFYKKLYTLLCDSKTATIPWLSTGGEGDDTYIMDVFAMGNVLVTVNTLQCAGQYLSDMKDEYCIMPLPMFDHEQYDKNSPSLGYSTQLGDTVCQYAICKAMGDEKIPAVTATLEYMGYYSKEWVTPTYYADTLGEKYQKDARVSEMLELIKEGIYTDFVFLWSNELENVTWKFRMNCLEPDPALRAVNLKSWHRTVQGELNKLLPKLEAAFCDESA